VSPFSAREVIDGFLSDIGLYGTKLGCGEGGKEKKKKKKEKKKRKKKKEHESRF
jgi:hypothetical protein